MAGVGAMQERQLMLMVYVGGACWAWGIEWLEHA